MSGHAALKETQRYTKAPTRHGLRARRSCGCLTTTKGEREKCLPTGQTILGLKSHAISSRYFCWINALLTRSLHLHPMVTRRRLRSFLNALALYTIAALLIGYFGVNAYTGEHGLIAKRDLDQDIAQLTAQLDAVKAERAVWQRRVSLLKSDSIDPDLLDERARQLLDDADPRDLVLMLKR